MDERFTAQVTNYVTVRERLGRAPLDRGDSADERRAARFLRAVRGAALSGSEQVRLDAGRVAILNEQIPEWTGQRRHGGLRDSAARAYDQRFAERVRGYAALRRELGRPPRRGSGDAREDEAAIFLYHFDLSARRKSPDRFCRVTPERIALLDEEVPDWRTVSAQVRSRRAFEERVAEYVNLRRDLGCPPSIPSGDERERSAATFMYNFRRAVRQTRWRLPRAVVLARIALMDERVPDWRTIRTRTS